MLNSNAGRVGAGFAGLVAATMLAIAPACAQKLKVVRFGKAVPTAFTFTPVDVGVKEGIWKKLGLDVQILSFHGDGQLQQALASNSIDFAIGSGPGMGYHSKGVPAIAVAAAAGPPKNMALIVLDNTPYKTIDDMKGKKIGVTTAGALTDWLVKELSKKKGWTGANAMKAVPMGSTRARLAAMKMHAIDGTIGTTDACSLCARQPDQKRSCDGQSFSARLVPDDQVHEGPQENLGRDRLQSAQYAGIDPR
jgi:NitT/TauT family transport system substrate-binding protein